MTYGVSGLIGVLAQLRAAARKRLHGATRLGVPALRRLLLRQGSRRSGRIRKLQLAAPPTPRTSRLSAARSAPDNACTCAASTACSSLLAAHSVAS